MKRLYSYLKKLSTSQTLAVIFNGAGPAYSISMALISYVGNIPSVIIGTFIGGTGGILTVYCSEKDVLKSVEAFKNTLKEKAGNYDKSRDQWLMTTGELKRLKNEQLNYPVLQDAAEWFNLVTKKHISNNKIIKNEEFPVAKVSSFLQTSNSLSIHFSPAHLPEEIKWSTSHSLEGEFENQFIENQKNLSHWQQLSNFIRTTDKFRIGSYISNFAATFYYMQYVLRLVLRLEIAFPVSAVSGILGGVLITYFSSKAALDEKELLEFKINQFDIEIDKISNFLITEANKIAQFLDLSPIENQVQRQRVFKQEVKTFGNEGMTVDQFFRIHDTIKKPNQNGHNKVTAGRDIILGINDNSSSSTPLLVRSING